MALYRSPDYQTSFESIGRSVQEKKLSINFQNGGHLGLPIRMISATFDLDTSDVVSNQLAFWFRIKQNQNRLSTWLLGRPSWIPKQHDFRYFLSCKKVREKSRECHNQKPQPFPDTKRKRKPTNPNKHKSNKRKKALRLALFSPSEVIAMLKGLKNTRTK